MPKYIDNQKGIAHVVLIIFLIVALVIGVWLVNQRTNFLPKALEVDIPPRVFISSTIYDGNLGGQSGADAKCQSRADAANLGGIWRAWISDNSISATDRLIHSVAPYTLINGVIVADNWTDLTDGTLQAPLNITELNTFNNRARVWTGTSANGSLRQSDEQASCANWTSNSINGITGDPSRTDGGWSDFAASSCENMRAIYCVEQIPLFIPSPTPIPTPSDNPLPSAEPSPSPSVLPTPSPSPIPSISPSPTPTLTPTPSPSPVTTQITIVALGTKASNVYPTMSLFLNGNKVQTWTNITNKFNNYIYTATGTINPSQIRVSFDNDGCNWSIRRNTCTEYRDLRIDKILINSIPYQTESSNVYYQNLDGECVSGYLSSEWLYCTGYMQY